MKKILLIALAAAMVCTANAQPFRSNRSGKKVSVAQTPAMPQVKNNAPVKAAPVLHNKVVTTPMDLGNRLKLDKNVKPLMTLTAASRAMAPLKAASFQESYTGMGTNYDTKTTETWQMYPSVYEDEDGTKTPVLVDLIPSIFDDGSVPAPYEQDGDQIVIKPLVVGQGADKEGNPYYIMLFSAVDEEGAIRLTLGDDGKISTIANEVLLYGAWEQPEYKYDDEAEELVGYLGRFSMYQKVKYLLPDEIPAPSALYEPAATYLHIGSSSSGYGYLSNLAVVPPFVEFPFKNLTSDLADGWSWTMNSLSYNSELEDYDVVESFTADTRDFTVNTESTVYAPAQLVASYSGKSGEAFSWGLPSQNENYPGRIFNPYVYGGQITDELEFSDGSIATLTRANTSDFGHYYSGSFLTPGLSDRDFKLSTLISYQGKPAAPLYITGVLFGVYQLQVKDDFNLKCKIQKVSFDEQGHFVLGDVLAESVITNDDLGEVGEYGSYLEFTNFYVEDEEGMTEAIDYLFVEDEFAVVFEGWDNGTFECYPLIDAPDFGIRANTYFFVTDEENDYPYYFTNNYQHLDLGFYGGWGYLHTTDNTNLAIADEGGTATIHVDPMYYNLDEETEQPTYNLYVESITVDGEEAEEFPEWLTVEVANEDYSKDADGRFIHGIDYDLVFTADALPQGVEGRTADIVFVQTGALLKVKVSQGASQGISTVVTRQPLNNRHTFNLAGQRIGNAKGIVVKDGRKVIVK